MAFFISTLQDFDNQTFQFGQLLEMRVLKQDWEPDLR